MEGKIIYGFREERFVDCYKIIKDEINEWVKEGDVYFYYKIVIFVVVL